MKPIHKALEKKKTKPVKKSFIERLEAHKTKARSFDDGTWEPSKKGETFIQSLEKHKESSFDEFR